MLSMIYRRAVTVSARPAKDLPGAANAESGVPGLGVVDMRGGSPVRAGTFPYDGGDLVTDWHRHDLHQIEYAFEGIAEVETEGAHYLLPPRQAVWIPAGLSHRTTLKRVRSVAVFFDPTMVQGANDRVRILAATPIQSHQLQRRPNDGMDRTPVLNMKEVDPLTKNLGLVIHLDS